MINTNVESKFSQLTFNSNEELKEALKKELQPAFMKFAQQTIDLNAKKKLAEQELQEARQRQAEARQMQAEGRQMQAEGRQMQAEGRQMRVEARQRQMNTLVTLFHQIFHGNKQEVPADQINTLFSKYLADGAISFEKEKRCFKLNYMKGVVSYLKDNSNVTQCDFRCFKTEISDIPTLAEYLKESKVKAIALNSGISEQAKLSMNEAVAARASTSTPLKVCYYA
jgi:hypothetical protein